MNHQLRIRGLALIPVLSLVMDGVGLVKGCWFGGRGEVFEDGGDFVTGRECLLGPLFCHWPGVGRGGSLLW
ncbi:MAG: hypothetical protein M0R02_16610, partial [Bacteroidales bacterium]|nr:hypothetical protein [Bacteroidales bacterium]